MPTNSVWDINGRLDRPTQFTKHIAAMGDFCRGSAKHLQPLWAISDISAGAHDLHTSPISKYITLKPGPILPLSTYISYNHHHNMKIVIVGGSYAGHTAFRSIFDNYLSQNIEVTLVSKTTTSYFNIASPRLLSDSSKLPETAFPIDKFVEKVGGKRAVFIHGEATEADFPSNTLVVKTSDGATTLDYDILVIASGSRSRFNGFKVNDSFELAQEAIISTVDHLKIAKLAAVIGGGPTGVETAAEIAYAYSDVNVTLYTGSKGPLLATPKLSSSATTKLGQAGATVINNVRTQKIDRTEKSTKVTFDNGEVKEFDVVIEATPDIPYSQYVPVSAQDEAGFVITDKHLIVKGTENVIALGDIVSGAPKTLMDIKLGQTGVFTKTIGFLLGHSATLGKEYSPVTHSIIVPISREGGVGLVFGYLAPNFLVKFVKAKSFMIEKAREWFS